MSILVREFLTVSNKWSFDIKQDVDEDHGQRLDAFRRLKRQAKNKLASMKSKAEHALNPGSQSGDVKDAAAEVGVGGDDGDIEQNIDIMRELDDMHLDGVDDFDPASIDDDESDLASEPGWCITLSCHC